MSQENYQKLYGFLRVKLGNQVVSLVTWSVDRSSYMAAQMQSGDIDTTPRWEWGQGDIVEQREMWCSWENMVFCNDDCKVQCIVQILSHNKSLVNGSGL